MASSLKTNHTKFWKHPLLPQVEFFKAEYTDFTYAPHFHEDYAIGVVEEGIHAFYYRGENFRVPASHIVTCQPGEVHNGHAGNAATWRYRMLYLQPTLLHEIAVELGYRPSALPFLSHTFIAHPHIVHALQEFHRESEEGEPLLSQEVQLREVLALILAKFSEIPLYPKALADEKAPIVRVQQVIHERYADDLRLDELAEVACLSKSYFIRAFRHHVGISPYAYLLQVRLNRAKMLLQNGIPATEVAHQTGFFDQSHFTRYFKRFLGIPPAQYQGAIG